MKYMHKRGLLYFLDEATEFTLLGTDGGAWEKATSSVLRLRSSAMKTASALATGINVRERLLLDGLLYADSKQSKQRKKVSKGRPHSGRK